MIWNENLSLYTVVVSSKAGESKKKWFFFSSSSGFYDVQVAQVLLTLPYSFSQLGMVSGIIFQVFYGLLGSYTAYLISILYIEYRSRKEKENVSFKNHVIQVRYQTTIQNFSTLYTVPFCFCSEIWNKFHFNFFFFFILQWFEVLEGLLGPYWKAIGLAFNCTFLLFGSVIQLIACARSQFPLIT